MILKVASKIGEISPSLYFTQVVYRKVLFEWALIQAEENKTV